MPNPTLAPQPKRDNKGPAPMELDATDKGKKVFTCNKCGWRGHMEKSAPLLVVLVAMHLIQKMKGHSL